KWPEAVSAFSAAVEIIPNDPRALVGLGYAAFQAGDYAKARKATVRAIRAAIDKDVKAAGLFNLGLVRAKAGDKTAARRAFAASVELDPKAETADELKKIGGTGKGDQPFCDPKAKLCDCIVADAFGDVGADEPTECGEAPEPSPVKGFHLYRAKSTAGYGGSW